MLPLCSCAFCLTSSFWQSSLCTCRVHALFFQKLHSQTCFISSPPRPLLQKAQAGPSQICSLIGLGGDGPWAVIHTEMSGIPPHHLLHDLLSTPRGHMTAKVKQYWMSGSVRAGDVPHVHVHIRPLREINRLLCGNSQSSVTSYFSPSISPVPFCHVAKRLDKTSCGSQHITFWQVTCVCVCVLRRWQVKEAEGRDVVFEEESSVKIPLGQTHMPLCVLAVLWPDFSAALHERDWCTSQRGQCAIRLYLSERLAGARQLH